MNITKTDVVIIGAGPAGSVAAALLVNRGRKVEVVERQHFPRFSIGESLLPQCMAFLAEAGLVDDIDAVGFQFKDGAAFHRNGVNTGIYFPDKTTAGPGTTYQVRREIFDLALANGAAAKGANISFGEEVIAFESDDNGAAVTVRNEQGELRRIEAKFALDASGFGRVLSRLLNLELPSDFPPRRSVFCHVRDHITEPSLDRNKILITVHPTNPEIWYWLIPLADGLSSIGAVGPNQAIEAAGSTDHDRLWNLTREVDYLDLVLKNAEIVRPANTIGGYACRVKSLVGPSHALLGNAAEFLDPVFSSGVTIAMKSAVLATGLIERKFNGESVDWDRDFVRELYVGIETFRACVEAWYSGRLQRIIFNRPAELNDATKMLTAVLAGYAWDQQNAIVREPRRFLRLLDELSAPVS
ncbi:MAG: NAD(P)/FAD-dependent oxidoreductase [Gemmatimonadaceae bacterium]